MRRERVPIVVVVPAAIGAAFFIVPLIGLIVRSPWGDAVTALTAPETVETAITSLIASPFDRALWSPGADGPSSRPGGISGRSASCLDDSLMVLRPVVGGIGLLPAFASSLLGSWLTPPSASPSRSRRGVMNETAAMPPSSPPKRSAPMDRIARGCPALGAWRVFTRVTLHHRSVAFAGAVLCRARLGELGAVVRRNFPGVTQTMPLAVYLLLETNQEASYILSLVLLLISLVVLVGLRDRWLRFG